MNARNQWRRWLIQGLLAGSDPQDLAAVLVARAGLSAAQAQETIQAEIADPRFRGAYRAASMQRKLEGLMRTYGALHRQDLAHDRVAHRDAGAASEVLRDLSVRSRPSILRGGLPALAWQRGLVLCRPRRCLAARGVRARLRPARTDLVLCPARGRPRVQLVPWCDSFATRAGSRLEVTLEPGEALVVPLGWWYRLVGPAGGAAVRYEIARAGDPVVTWRRPEEGSILLTPRPRGRAHSNSSTSSTQRAPGSDRSRRRRSSRRARAGSSPD